MQDRTAIKILAALACAAAGLSAQTGKPFTEGNLIVSQANTLHEYTRTGKLVRSVPVPHPGTPPQIYWVSDAVMDRIGRVHVTTQDPNGADYLSTYDPIRNSWRHTEDKWNWWITVGGDMARLGDYVWTTHQRFRVDDMSAQRIDLKQSGGTSELTIGCDGLLYATSGGSPASTVRVADPITNKVLRDVYLKYPSSAPFPADGLAVAANGDIYASGNLTITRFDPTGKMLNSIKTTRNVIDLDIAADGTVVGAMGAFVVLTDLTLTTLTSFPCPHNIAQTYVTFVSCNPSGSLRMMADNSSPAPLDKVRITSCESVPGNHALFMIVEVDHKPAPQILDIVRFGVDGRATREFTVPPGLTGRSITLRACTCLEASNCSNWMESNDLVIRFR